MLIFTQGLLCCFHHVQKDSQFIITAISEDVREFMVGNLDGVREAVNEQVIRGNIQCICHPNQRVETAKLIRSFHIAHVRRRAIDSFCKLHLGDTFLCPDGADFLSEKDVIDLQNRNLQKNLDVSIIRYALSIHLSLILFIRHSLYNNP